MGWKGGWRPKREEKRSCRLRYGTEKKLIYWSWTFMQGGAEGVGVAGLRGCAGRKGIQD